MIRRRFRGIPVAVLAAICMAGGASAQPSRLAPGNLLYNGADQQVKILECRPLRLGGRECETVLWEEGRAASNPSWWNEKMLLDGDARVRRQLALPARGGATPQVLAGAAVKSSVEGVPVRRVAAAPAPAPAAAGRRAADGRYTCQTWMGNSYVNLGAVQLSGGRLRPDPVARTGGTITGIASAPGGITISYTTARGYRESMDCKRG